MSRGGCEVSQVNAVDTRLVIHQAGDVGVHGAGVGVADVLREGLAGAHHALVGGVLQALQSQLKARQNGTE